MVDLPITQQVFWKVGLANLGKFAPVDEDGENDECLHQNCKCRRVEMGDTQLFNRAAQQVHRFQRVQLNNLLTVNYDGQI